jgi:hypothetical protein
MDVNSSPLCVDLSADERRELERRHYVRKGDELVWIELDGDLRREPVSSVYYIRTERGVFRLSRINGQVIEV